MYSVSGNLATASRQPSPLRPVFTVNTRDAPPGAQYVAWREQVKGPAEVEPCSDPAAGFVAEQIGWDLEGLVMTRSVAPAVTFQRNERRIRSDGIDHWVLSVPRRGIVRTNAGGQVTHLAAGGIKVQSLQSSFEGETTDFESVDLFVPRDFCRAAAITLDMANNTEITTGMGVLLADYLLNLEQRLALMTQDDLAGLRSSIQAMILACISPGPDTMFEARESIQATVLERARRIIQLRLFLPTLSAEELCLELGVSRSRLYRMFEPLGGVVHYIRHRRLLATHAALSNVDDRRTILEIAATCGFMDPAEFSRAFKREFGYRPTDARSHTTAGPRNRPNVPADSAEKLTLSHLLVGLQ